MANVLQDYYDRMTALNRQRGMTGNMQYGRALDASIAEGYFDSYEKNKNQSRQLAIMQQNADTAKYAAEQNSKYQQRSLDFQNKALRDQQMWQVIGTGLYGIGTLAKAYNDYTANNRALPMPPTPQTYNNSNAEWIANQWSANQLNAGASGMQIDFSQPAEPLDTTYEWDMSGDIGWSSILEPDFASSISIGAGW